MTQEGALTPEETWADLAVTVLSDVAAHRGHILCDFTDLRTHQVIEMEGMQVRGLGGYDEKRPQSLF